MDGNNLKKQKAILILLVCVIILGILTLILCTKPIIEYVNTHQELSRINEEIVGNDEEITSLEVLNSSIDEERVERDNAKIEKLIESVTTWNSASSYEAARTYAIDNFDLNEKFTTSFMPEVEYYTNEYGVDQNNVEANRLEIKFEDIIATPIKIEDGVYSYFTIVNTTGSDEYSDYNKILFRYDSDEEGNINNIMADRVLI